MLYDILIHRLDVQMYTGSTILTEKVMHSAVQETPHNLHNHIHSTLILVIILGQIKQASAL